MFKNSQTAIEFLVLVSAVLFFFVIFFFVIGENIQDRMFKIPESLNGLDYEISLGGGIIYLKTNNGKFAVTLPVQNVTGEIIKGENVLRKEEGKVYLNS
jgi:preprotein translocase subunit YajC